MPAEGAPLKFADGADSRHCLPYALLATAIVVVAPALVVLPLAPLEGFADLVLSAVLAIGLSVAAGSACSALWSRRPESREVVFGDLMLWRWARRALAERRLSEGTFRLAAVPAAVDEAPSAGDPLLPALRRLVAELEARDSFMHGTSERVARHAERIATQLGLPEEEVARIEAAASVHDIGKLFVPHSILTQPSRLTQDELALVRRHAEQGAEVVSELGDPELTAIVRHHHERVDGGGYPDGLAGGDIPIGARVVAVAETFVALTSERPYRRAASQKSALDVLSECAGSQLDPGVVAAFLDYYSAKRGIAGMALIATAPQRLVSWIAATPSAVSATAAPIAHGACAAGAVAVAGVCMGGVSGLTTAADSEQRTPQRSEQSIARGQDGARPAGGSASPTGARDGGRQETRRDEPRSGRWDAPADTPSSQVGGGGGSVGQPKGAAPQQGQSPLRAPPTPPVTPVTPPDVGVPKPPVAPLPLPVDPPPVLDRVDQLPLPPPVQDLTDPVKKALGQTGLASPAP